jgi:ankyrin repeat protein
MSKPSASNSFNSASEMPTAQTLKDFFAAADRGDAEEVKAFQEFFPALSVSRDPSTQRTALVVAALKGNTDVMEALIEGGADIGATDVAGMDALCYAAYYGHSDSCMLLINSGADALDTGKRGVSAAAYARAGEFFALGDRLEGLGNERREALRAAWNEHPADVGTGRPVTPMKPLSLKAKG